MEIEYIDGFPQPYPLLDAEPYWAALDGKKLTFQQCTTCDEAIWPAHSICPQCGEKSLEWRPSKGRGKIYSFSTVGRGPTPAWQAIAPYTVGFIEMDEGYFLFSQIEGDPTDMEIGRDVEVTYVQRGAQTLPVFRFC